MKNLFLCFTIMLIFGNQIIAKDYNISDYGAEKDKLSTAAIQKTIENCSSVGGGRVIVPAGIYITGTIFLKSNVNIYLEAGAVLSGSENLDDYSNSYRKNGIIFCEDAYNVSISGNGTIQANGIKFYDPSQNHTYDEFEKSRTRQKENYMPEGSFFTDGPIKRMPKPGMTIVFFHCTKVSVTGVTILDTPSWATRFGYCDDLFIDGITIQNNILIPNSDGIHCTVSRNIRISNCHIVAGDDAIVLTGFSKDEKTPVFTTEEQDKHTYWE